MQFCKARSRKSLWLMLVAATVSLVTVPAFAQGRRQAPYAVGVTVFTNPNFGGESASFRDDTPTLVPYRLNDKISSIEIPQGEAWEVCQDVNYGNRCQVLSSSVPDLRNIGWNDRISSLRMVRGGFQGQRSGGVSSPGYYPPSYAQTLVIFDRPGFKGASRTITGQSSNLGLGGRGGSVELQGGGAWELCDRNGRCATVNQNVQNLSQLGLSGQIASARPLNNQRYDQGNDRGRQNRSPEYRR